MSCISRLSHCLSSAIRLITPRRSPIAFFLAGNHSRAFLVLVSRWNQSYSFMPGIGLFLSRNYCEIFHDKKQWRKRENFHIMCHLLNRARKGGIPLEKNKGCCCWRFQLKRDYFGQLHLTYPLCLFSLSLSLSLFLSLCLSVCLLSLSLSSFS